MPMKHTKQRSPDVPWPYEAPECTLLLTSPENVFCASGSNEDFNEIPYDFDADFVKCTSLILYDN